jgi:hypothetical protein
VIWIELIKFVIWIFPLLLIGFVWWKIHSRGKPFVGDPTTCPHKKWRYDSNMDQYYCKQCGLWSSNVSRTV